MSAPSGKTKAEILEELGAAKAKIAEYEAAVYAAPPRPKVVPEATALAECVRAIDRMLEGEGRPSSTRYAGQSYPFDMYSNARSQSTTERLLRSLAAKYQVELIERQMMPCDRPHLDGQISDRIAEAVRLAVQS